MDFPTFEHLRPRKKNWSPILYHHHRRPPISGFPPFFPSPSSLQPLHPPSAPPSSANPSPPNWHQRRREGIRLGTPSQQSACFRGPTLFFPLLSPSLPPARARAQQPSSPQKCSSLSSGGKPSNTPASRASPSPASQDGTLRTRRTPSSRCPPCRPP